VNLLRAAPFALPGVMAAYNAYATLLSGAMFALFVAQFARHTPGLALLTYRLPLDAQGDAALRLWAAAMWVNYQSKYVEYADTLIAVLRGKTLVGVITRSDVIRTLLSINQ
jgi:hypothetical protein